MPRKWLAVADVEGRLSAWEGGNRSRRECVEGHLSFVIFHLSLIIFQWKEYDPAALPLSMINE